MKTTMRASLALAMAAAAVSAQPLAPEHTLNRRTIGELEFSPDGSRLVFTILDAIGQSQRFYRGLKRYGVDANLVLYPREGHTLREEHVIDRLNRIIAVCDKYLKPDAAKASEPQR